MSTHRNPAPKDSQEASLRYFVVARGADATVIAVQLLSGRKHQIRVQFADRGHPVIGDTKYGSKRPFPAGVALHSWRLRISHPTRRESQDFIAELPKSWRGWSREIGNLATTWQRVEHFFDDRPTSGI